MIVAPVSLHRMAMQRGRMVGWVGKGLGPLIAAPCMGHGASGR